MTSSPPRLTSEPSGTPEGEQAQDPRKREEQAKNVCLRLLTVRARTRAELTEQLTKRGYEEELSAKVLDRLTEVGLIDDEDFAEQWVRSRHANAGKGKRAWPSNFVRRASTRRSSMPRWPIWILRPSGTGPSSWFVTSCVGNGSTTMTAT
ncbi:recombination regulator RecX [Mycolicibacterium conceptionense]|uniref:Regulatory protein RecX n=1 Tax=Mycolicibacterium conceptionense TaxID=451644 RepID=A0A0U1DVN2_9MYCO|nr:recombination regulator RecX [Mycolicibacterium conceptionense]